MVNHNFQELFAILALLLFIVPSTATPKRPNIVLILTDDQDVTLHGMFPLQEVHDLIAKTGATFTNAFTSSPICCPSRATLLTGMYAHNHHTTNNSFNGGCNGKHWRSKIEPYALPTQLAAYGYRNFYAGKYLNEYRGDIVPPGWHEFYGLHGNSRYYNYTLRENAQNVSYTDEYLTDLLRERTLDFISKATTPFFAMIAPPAAHAPFTPAERHKNAYAGIKALRTPNFNQIAGPLEKHWLVAAARTIPPATLENMDKYFQQRWETLLAVDELVAAIVRQLEKQAQLDSTYIIYTSDNGYHIGQFAQPFDKRQPYETDIRVPLLIRGPGIAAGVSVTAPVGLVDLAPTILVWAKLPVPNTMDGQTFDAYLSNANVYDALLDKQFHRSLLVQYWGEGNDDTYNPACPGNRADHLAECTLDADCHCQDAWNNTYACVRHFRYPNVDRLYCEFRDNESFVEAYDLMDDPYQLDNIGYEMLPIERALYSLALANLTRCTGVSCNDVII